MPFDSRDHPENLPHQLSGHRGALLLALLAVCMGGIAGIVSIAFRAAIELAQAFMLPRGFEALALERRLVLPIAGTLCAIAVIFLLGRGRLSAGVVHVLERLACHDARLPFRNALLQFAAGSLLLIFGMSLGREGPAIHLGAASGSLFGQWCRLSHKDLRILVGGGVAAAIAGAFNTPLAGVLLAMEVVLTEYTVSGFVPILLAAMTGAVLSRWVYGPAPAFLVPQLALVSLRELPLVGVVGILMGAFAAAFILLVRGILRLTQRSRWWLPMAMAGALVGACGIAVPQVLGIGYDIVNRVLLGQYAFAALAAIAALKLLATAIGIGARLPGGLIGPTLVIGAAAGGALGHVARVLMPVNVSDVGLYAMVGMGAMMAATLQAPLAALLAVFELTGNPHVVLPGLLAIALATLAAKPVFHCESVFAMQLQVAGHRRLHSDA